MKKTFFLLVICLLVVVFILSSCQFSSMTSGASEGEGYTSDYAIAVVKSNVSNNSTYIEYYDENLNLVKKLEYPYSTLENSWGKPERYADEVFMAAQGVEGIRNSSVVVGLNTKTGVVKEYDTGIKVLKNATANEHYIFASNNLNGEAKIVRIERF